MSESILGSDFSSLSDIDQVLQGCANTNYQLTELRSIAERSNDNNSGSRGIKSKTRNTIPYHRPYCQLNPTRDPYKSVVDGRTRIAKQATSNIAISDFVTDALGTNSDTDVPVAQPMDEPIKEENIKVNVE